MKILELWFKLVLHVQGNRGSINLLRRDVEAIKLPKLIFWRQQTSEMKNTMDRINSRLDTELDPAIENYIK